MITAIFPEGVTSMTVHGLYQWDYGQELRIVADGLPSLVEVHFACPGMAKAAVRVATITNNTATVPIPDKCLEQAQPVTAWVYIIDDTSGRTEREITLPIIARAKPAEVGSSAEETRAGTRYDELFSLTERVMADYEEVDADIQAAIEAGASAKTSAQTAIAAALDAESSMRSADDYAQEAVSCVGQLKTDYLRAPYLRGTAQGYVAEGYTIWAPIEDTGAVRNRHGALFVAYMQMVFGSETYTEQFIFFWDGYSYIKVASDSVMTELGTIGAYYLKVTPTTETKTGTKTGRTYKKGVVTFHYVDQLNRNEGDISPQLVRIIPLTDEE